MGETNQTVNDLFKSYILATSKPKETTLIDSVETTKSKVKDAYSNAVLGIGGEDKVEQFSKYGLSNDTLNWWLWIALYHESWVFRRAIDKPSQDVVNHGITLEGNSNKENVYKQLNKQIPDLTQLVMWGSLFGGSVAVTLFNDIKFEDMEKSINVYFNSKKINKKSILKLYVTDRWYGLSPTNDDLVSDMRSIDYGKPKYYNVTLANGSTYKIHHSWVLRYEHRVAPNLVKKGMLQNWGYAEGVHIFNELSRDDKIKASIHSLIDKSLIEVIKMPGMRGVFMGSDSDNENQLRKRLDMVNWGRNFNSLTFLDKDDEYQQNSFPGLTGLSDLLEKNMWLVAAALDMQGILFGDLKGGFSNDTEAMARYNETIQNRKNTYFRMPLTHLLEILYKMYDIKDDVEFEFNSLIVQKEDDRLKELSSFGDFLSKMLSDGILNPQQVARSIQKYSKKSGIDIEISDDDIDKLKDTIVEEMEEIEFPEDEDNKDENKVNIKNVSVKKNTKDTYVNDITHSKWIEKKWNKEYPLLRAGWYEVDPEKQAKSKIQLHPSFYLFSDKFPPGRHFGAQAHKNSIRFSNHSSVFECADDIRFSQYNRTEYEQSADKYIANHPELMEKLYKK